MTQLRFGAFALAIVVAGLGAQAPRTAVTQWQDGKAAAVAITYDDSTINQFRIALPLMNERGLVGTFFVITGQIPGSIRLPTFVGRPIMEILRESATVPTSAANVYERTSMLRYLGEIQRDEIVLASRVQPTNLAGVDAVLAKLRDSGKTYAVGAIPYTPVRSEEAGRPLANGPGALSWDEMRKVAAQGHEIANHSVTHARLPLMDEANVLYEVDQAREELRTQVGEKYLFSIEAPYGIDDERIRKLLIDRFPLTRNWVSDADGEFMDGIMRGDRRDPASTTKPYMEWERGPVTATPLSEMTGWVETSAAHGTWLVLVIHGIDGVGYQPIPLETIRAYFDYLKANADRVWIATYQDGAKYIRERMKSAVSTRPAGQAIEVTVTHPLDPKVYDVPLTVRTTVPAGWTAARVVQGRNAQTIPVRQEHAGPYVQYRVTPGSEAVRITSTK